MTIMATPEQPVERADPLDGPVSAPAEPAADPPAPPSIAAGVEHPLDPRSVRVRRITGWLVAGPILGGQLLTILLLVLLAPLPGWAELLLLAGGAAVTLVLVWSAHSWPAIEHRHACYKVDERGIEMRRGVVWRKVINVPRSRVQHTDVSQGPLERSHGLATLVIYTAGTNHARVDLHGLDHATALGIRDHLLAGEGDDAV